jgi:pimeloyl-ACP methyl ester carboxylesterase
MTIVRPVVVGVHGIWDTRHLFDSILPTDGRFNLTTAAYDRSLANQISPAGTILYGADVLPGTLLGALASSANENQLGFSYNAPNVRDRILKEIDAFRRGQGVGFPLAAVQADVVAHSMGGLVVRTAETLPGFFAPRSFNKGSIQKLITVGTPHFGSQWASIASNSISGYALIQTQRLGFGSTVVFADGTKCNGNPCSGALYDLQVNGTGATRSLSPALTLLLGNSWAPVPTHTVAGEFDASNTSAPGDVATWNDLVFSGLDSDAVVAVTSQLATTNVNAASDITSGLFHCKAAVDLGKVPYVGKVIGFQGPYELQPGGKLIPHIIDLLQTPKQIGCTLGVFSWQAAGCSLFLPMVSGN